MKARVSGVYLIKHKGSCNRYVGSSIHVARRFREHLRRLRRGNHCTPHLQQAWNKYGEHSFEFVIYKLVPPNKKKLMVAEQAALDRFSQSLYNTCMKAHSRLGDKQSTHTRKILKEKGLAQAATPAGRAHLVAMAKIAHGSATARASMIEALRKDSRSAEGRNRRRETAKRLHREGRLGGSSEEMRRRYLLTERAQRGLAKNVTNLGALS